MPANPLGPPSIPLFGTLKHGRVNLNEALLYDNGGPPGGGGGGDSTPPVMSNVGSAKLKGNRFEITWSTDEAADSRVTFVCCGPSMDDALVTQHRMTFRGGKGALYPYTVTSTDGAGNLTTDGPYFHQNKPVVGRTSVRPTQPTRKFCA